MLLATVLLPIILFPTAQSIPVDNGVEGEPEIECGSTTITVNFNTRNSFEGHVYVKPRFLTKVDRAYRVSCFYMEATKDVRSNIDVAELTTASVTGLVPMPVCRYDILEGGVRGSPLQFGKIGQQVYHQWTCTSQTVNTFCMLVHSCTVDDGKGDRVNILDVNGCAIDRYVLNNIEYPEDLVAGQEAHVYKYADRDSLFYQCQISIQVKEAAECQRPACPDLLSSPSKRVFSNYRQGPSYASIPVSGSYAFTTANPYEAPPSGHEDGYPSGPPLQVLGPGPIYKVEPSSAVDTRLLRRRRSKSFFTDRPFTLDVRAEMKALDIDEMNYPTPTASVKRVCLTYQVLVVSAGFTLIIICSLLLMALTAAIPRTPKQMKK